MDLILYVQYYFQLNNLMHLGLILKYLIFHCPEIFIYFSFYHESNPLNYNLHDPF